MQARSRPARRKPPHRKGGPMLTFRRNRGVEKSTAHGATIGAVQEHILYTAVLKIAPVETMGGGKRPAEMAENRYFRLGGTADAAVRSG